MEQLQSLQKILSEETSEHNKMILYFMKELFIWDFLILITGIIGALLNIIIEIFAPSCHMTFSKIWISATPLLFGLKNLRNPEAKLNLHKKFLNEKNLILDELETEILKNETDPVEAFKDCISKLRIVNRNIG